MTTFPEPGSAALRAWYLTLPVDKWGARYAHNGEGLYYPTECCGASAKGMEGGVGCRACYAEVDTRLGGIPEPDPDRETADIAALTAAAALAHQEPPADWPAVFAADREATAMYSEWAGRAV